jgi:topoisomerase-4 subunit A
MAEENEESEFAAETNDGNDHQLQNVIQVSGMYNEWFLDYASYVILERAVPHLHDGLKPVQRRILHSLYELEDGRFHKVANVIGNTMKYHPHGDASIGDAMVQIGQKNLLLDIQGNWGNIFTGDRAAAPRYIEVRLSKFAKDVVFNPKVTQWLLSYDGRAKEPRTLPVKFPLLLAQGAEGIAVGLACKILPHNFLELIDASIDILKGKKAVIYPDFPTGGMMDASGYNDGLRGSRVRVRAKIRKEDNKTLVINDIPFGTTTSSLIDSILKANDKGKIKVRKIEDNTAEHVEIVVHLAAGVSPDKTIDALYAFSDCEVSIAPNACVIEDDRPRFVGVNEMLKLSTERTKDLLRQELEIRKSELEEQWHFSSLEKIFIEKRIYRNIEECETWDDIIQTIHKGLKPHVKKLMRKVTDEDVARLTEIKIKRISKFDAFKADEKIRSLEDQIAELAHNLEHLTDYTIAYFKDLKDRYGKGRERKTEIKAFDTIDRTEVAVANEKLYVNKEEGFIGTGLKRGEGEFISDCSDIDDVIVFRSDGTMLVTKVSQKAFVGKGIIHAQVWKKGDDRTIYNCIYRDGKQGKVYLKRFPVTAITRDKEYPLTKGTAGSEILYFSANPNGEAEVVTILLKPLQRLRKLKFDVDFSIHAIKGRAAQGNIISRYPVKKVELKEKGVSTLGARQIYYDETVQRLNADGRGRFLGDFRAEDKLLVILDNGCYKLLGFDLSTHFDANMIHLEKWEPEKPVTAIYFDGEKQTTFVKRFLPEFATKEVCFISESPESQLVTVSTIFHPQVILRFNKKFKNSRDREDELIELSDFITVKGVKAQGNKLSNFPIAEVELQQPQVEKEAASEAQFREEQEARRKEAQANSAVDDDDDDFEPQDPNSVLFEIELPPIDPEKKKKKRPEADDDEDVQPTLF